MNKPPEFVEPAQFWTIQGVSPLDAVLALAFALSFIDSFSVAAASWGSLATFALVIIGIVVSCAMVFRRTSPVRSAGVIYACMIVRFIASPTDLIISDLAILFALWTVVAYGPLVVRVAAIVSAIIGGILLTIARIGLLSPPDLIIFFLLAESLIIIVATTGAIRRMRLDKIKTVVLDAHRAKREAERESELAVVEERNRIARDMHDVVAHTLTTVITQADGGLYAAKTNPQAAQKTLDLISHIARDALADMRAIIGVLRAGDDPASPRHPQPDVNDIPSLFDQVQEIGHRAEFHQVGDAYALPTGVGTSLFRICQEAITNSLKYGGDDVGITGTLSWMPTAVTLEVLDDGPGVSITDGRGHGIIGMHERAGAFGGTVTTGAGKTGGFKVTARFPLN
ncbi:sensor histidine kinase [Arcanobacterium canis]|uniref:histidine kinase n=1 Tax=Arcanobacterium canis TaxID=999183 RepID=A0ABY8FWP7_9ACTO|nr:sensor histidine kinase [Arcanobacterium canis]WFM82939.1 sensor histidine kinase [Arcanobacterium canis]